ncbi:DNA-binding protein [Streptomyces sp. XD-27]|uniref:DNA-binding protein n=1 Tax=Streptomyces sp. XD-27 TaxID=3062779 RepID=UPI0026F42B15|nr:DNA-binding protein [Streptomyces sp. XD-27]WKX70790.1 DNA-binding protein [Streptomyces sp. XD-27]
MARSAGKLTEDALVLDSEGLSKLALNERTVATRVDLAKRRRMRVAVSGMTLIEVHHEKINRKRFDWTVSGLEIVYPTEKIIRHAMALLAATGLHGHKYAIDAVVAATVLSFSGRRMILTSDADDMEKLCGDVVEIVTT